MTIEAMKQALEALEQDNPLGRSATITALRTAIAEAEKQEPVAWANINKHGDITHTNNKRMPWSKTPLYTTPPAAPVKDCLTTQTSAQRQPLTDEQIREFYGDNNNFEITGPYVIAFARAIEAAHGITGEKK